MIVLSLLSELIVFVVSNALLAFLQPIKHKIVKKNYAYYADNYIFFHNIFPFFSQFLRLFFCEKRHFSLHFVNNFPF